MANKNIPTFAELRELFREIAADFKEIRATAKETTAQIKELRANSKATDVKIKELTRAVDANRKNISSLSDKWGDLGEAMTVGEAKDVLNRMDGIALAIIHPNFTPKYNGKEYEIDGLAIGDDMVVVIEAKTTLKQHDIRKFIEKLKIFTKILPIYEGKKIYGAMGFLSASAAVQAFAQEQGLLLILPTETNKAIVSFPKGFKLRNFHP